MASFSILTAFWIIKTSQAKERSKEKQRGKSSKVKKTEDSSCSLPSHFWRTSRSPFFSCYIPFQSLGSQESNASNCIWFGAEMRKIWPSEDNCSRLVRNSHNTLKFAQHLQLVRRLCETRTTLAQPMRGVNFPLFLHARTTDFPDIFSFIFSRVNSFCNLVFSWHKALSCNFAIYRGAQRLQLNNGVIDPLYINLEIHKALFFSLLLFFPISIFLVAK